jgi:hypothetical protein
MKTNNGNRMTQKPGDPGLSYTRAFGVLVTPRSQGPSAASPATGIRVRQPHRSTHARCPLVRFEVGRNALCQVTPPSRVSHCPLAGPGFFRVLLIGMLGIALFAGCSKKVVHRTSLFDLGSVFSGQRVEPEPDDKTWKEKGLLLVEERAFDKAIHAFTRYVEEEPEEFFGFNAIAICYKNSGDYSQAMKNFERAFELAESEEDRSKILSNIGNLYFATNRPQAALGYYKEAASRFEKNPLYLILIARTFILLNEPDRAQKVLTTAEAIQGNLKRYERPEDRGLGHYLMAYCYVALGDEDKVLKYVDRALKANPEKYVTRLKKDLRDEKNLFFTMKEDPDLEKLVRKYTARLSPAFWLDES